jgi:hypothetical protein
VDSITIDGLDEHDFRRSIENMLRHGEADDAASRLRALVEPYAGEHGILPARFLTVSADEVALAGWDTLAQRLDEYDRPDHEISAVSVVLTHPEDAGVQPDAAGKLAPAIATAYYSDEAYPFSQAGREDLLDGYSLYGCQWDGDFETSDSTLSFEGIDDLYGAVVRLETKLLNEPAPRNEEILAGSIGACYLAVLMHQAVRDSIRKHGLPRPLCVIAGSNGAYPFFDAPVMSSEEYLEGNGVEPVTSDSAQDSLETEEAVEESSGYQSLLSLSIRRTDKKPVLLLDSAEAAADAHANELAAMQRFSEPAMPVEIGLPVEIETPAIEMPEPVEPAASFAQSDESVPPVTPAEDHGEPRQWAAAVEPAEFAEPTLRQALEPEPTPNAVELAEPVASGEPAEPMQPIEPVAAFEDYSAPPEAVEEEAPLPEPTVTPAKLVPSTLEEKLDMWMKRLEVDRAKPAEPPVPNPYQAPEPPRPAAFEPLQAPVFPDAPANLPESPEFIAAELVEKAPAEVEARAASAYPEPERPFPEPVEETPAAAEAAVVPDFQQPERPLPEPVEQWPAPAEATDVPAYSAPEPESAEPQIAQPAAPRPKPVPAPAGHSLRAKIAQTKPPRQKTWVERIVALLQSLGWLR